MGIYDRDYYRAPRQGGAFFGGNASPWSVNTWLIVINVAVFLLDSLFARSGVGYRLVIGRDEFGNPVGPVFPLLEGWGHFSIYTALLHGQLWRFVTFQFLHANLNHILFNMFSLYLFGQLIEQYLGRWRYLAFYLLCGVAGPVMYIALWAAGLLGGGMATPLVGASAGIFGVLIAAAAVAPDAQVLVYGIVPVRLRTFAWVMLGIAVFTIFSSGTNAGGQAAHLGGAAAGYALIRNPRALNVFDRLTGPRRPSMRYRP